MAAHTPPLVPVPGESTPLKVMYPLTHMDKLYVGPLTPANISKSITAYKTVQYNSVPYEQSKPFLRTLC